MPFQKNFSLKEVESESYFRQLVRYIHWNPHLHKDVNSFRDYPYSSFGTYLHPESDSFINSEKTVALYGGLDNFLAAHNELKSLQKLDEEFGN